MLLAIDIGNTNTVLGVFDGEKLDRSWRIKTDARSTADELALTYPRAARRPSRSTGIAACSTVPAAMRELRQMLADYYADVPTVLVEPGVRTGVEPAVRQPEGGRRRPDRQHRSPRYHLVRRAGDRRRLRHLHQLRRGQRARRLPRRRARRPGIEISLDALAARAAQLRKVELVEPRGPIGKNTVEALQSGILYGFAGQVDGMVRRLRAALVPDDPGVGRGDRDRWAGAAGDRPQRDGDPVRARPDPARPAPDLRAQRLIDGPR